MQVRYFVHHQGKNLGPWGYKEIEERYQQNQLIPSDFVFDLTRGDWQPILEFMLVQASRMQKQKRQPVVEDDNYYPLPPPQLMPTLDARLVTAKIQTNSDLPPPPVTTRTTKPNQPPLKRAGKTPRPIDASAVATINVLPPKATRLHIEIHGEARVDEEIEIVVHALSEAGAIDNKFAETIYLGCNRPLAAIEPLQFEKGVARTKVRCLTPGAHQFHLSLNPIIASHQVNDDGDEVSH